MEINHFSHEHPLSILNKEAHKNENCNEVVCYGCGIPIADCDDDNSTAYECATCNLFLHKRCAEAPTQLLHPMHSQHPSTLLSHPSYPGNSTCICSICNRGDWKWFTYNCSQCQFDVDIVCALDTICALKEDRRFENNIHQHPLTLQLRPALFHCDACGTKSEDYSYQCTTCQFWIHKTCALLPSTIKLNHHKHTLKLAYSFPDMHRGFRYNCDICLTTLPFYYWLYYCGNCRYFVHVKCATTSYADPELLLQREDEDHQNLVLFPIPDDRSADLMIQFIKKISLGDADCDREGEVEINHWSHNDHPLLLWDNQRKNKLNINIVYDGMFCAACMQPIIAPFYHCSQCSYFLHRYCAVLPLELQYPGHPDHPLKLGYVFTMFACASCRTASSGFFYGCETCSFFIDIGCVSLPTKILHESHAHSLVTSTDSRSLCNSCDQWFSGFFFNCETCSYKLNYRCATMLPHTLTHDYDEHPIYLTYPPIEDHPSEFYCEICEEEIHPKFWLYYCQKCSYSFHIDCIRPLDLYFNVKFGGIHEVDNHQHPLTFVRNGRNKSSCTCAICRKDKKGDPVLECSECGFIICLECDQ